MWFDLDNRKYAGNLRSEKKTCEMSILETGSKTFGETHVHILCSSSHVDDVMIAECSDKLKHIVAFNSPTITRELTWHIIWFLFACKKKYYVQSNFFWQTSWHMKGHMGVCPMALHDSLVMVGWWLWWWFDNIKMMITVFISE